MYPDSSLKLNYQTNDTLYFFSAPFEPLNNWSANIVKLWGETFPTVEHAFHYRKFSDDNPGIAKEILEAPSPWAAMQVERINKDKRRKDWSDIKVAVMTEIIRAKVKQNEDVRGMLVKTGDKQIVENSPWDSFWGCGKDGKGQNQMGKILMEIRKEIQ